MSWPGKHQDSIFSISIPISLIFFLVKYHQKNPYLPQEKDLMIQKYMNLNK